VRLEQFIPVAFQRGKLRVRPAEARPQEQESVAVLRARPRFLAIRVSQRGNFCIILIFIIQTTFVVNHQANSSRLFLLGFLNTAPAGNCTELLLIAKMFLLNNIQLAAIRASTSCNCSCSAWT
jgi:hypothetical protein